MTPLARWFNRPRKNSTPARLALSEFMNISSSHQQQKSTFPPTNRNEPTQGRTPMLITSSFYDQEYPFDKYESSADEAVSRPNTPDLQLPQQYQTTYQQTSYVQEPTHLIDIPQQITYVNTPQHHSMPPLTQYYVHQEHYNKPHLSQYIDIPQPTQYLSQPSTSREDITFQSYEQRPQQSRYRSTHERVPTPYTNERYPDEKDSQETNGKRFSAEDIAGFEKLKDDFKKLEKRHKRKEKRVQELEYLLYSQSLESAQAFQHPCNYYYSYYYHSLEEKERMLRDYFNQQQKWTHNDVRKNRPF